MNNNIKDFKGQVLDLYQEGRSQQEIADALHSTRDKVRYILKKEGLTKRKVSRVLTCKGCGKKFTSKSEAAKFCEDRCKSSYNRTNRGIERECEWCKVKYRRNVTGKYCSHECSNQSARKIRLIRRLINALTPPKEEVIKMVSCLHCKGEFKERGSNKKFCSKECYQKHRYENYIKPDRKKYHKKCVECGKHYSSTAKRSSYCSALCSNRFNWRRSDVIRRERIKQNGEVNWDINVERLVKRDRGVCHLCGDKVDVNDCEINSEGHFIAMNNYPSIDHVIPVSKGGTHTWGNVKLAHRICNSIKSDAIEYELIESR